MTESYYDKMKQGQRAAYIKQVVAQPTRQSEKRAVVDKTSYTGIRQAKDKPPCR